MMHFPRTIAAALGALAFFSAGALHAAEPRDARVLFVCEHGYAKSLMAASYFDQLAKERGLPFRALSRGSAPNSDTVPPGIVKALSADGVDVGDYRPARVDAADVASVERVIVMGATLPDAAVVAGVPVERWDDVPTPIVYDAARDVIKKHVEELLDELSR